MTASQREQVEEFFCDLSTVDAKHRPEALLRIADLEVRAEVASLLEHIDPGTVGIDAAIAQAIQAASSAGAFEDRSIGPGTRFENYRIERRIGQGGMGDVYEAIRESDFHKRVALKIVRHGLDNSYARARFQQERQLLAGLEHPFIARLLDGGEASNGCPYLVLEFVEGVPIDVWCRDQPQAATLKLFLKVCDSVEYAHRNLTIHRDLKPANILVTAQGDPKLLDFGIAKLLDPGADVTQTGLVALTPQYASPEQVRGESISTASDVYSLGVILYELLTGRRPYQLETTAALEMDRVICQQPPSAPGLGNELDHILLMALRKEPSRRYAGVLQFAQDIERYLENRPVSAQPDSTVYRARKYIRRHWVGLIAASITLAAIVGGAGASLYQAHRAQQRFNDVRQLANRFLFDFEGRIRSIPGATDARQYVVATALEFLEKLSVDAKRDPALQWELATAYLRIGEIQGDATQGLGRRKDAIMSYQKAIAIQEDLARHGEMTSARTPTFVRSYEKLSTVYRLLRDAPRAEAAATKGVEQAAQIGGKTEAVARLHMILAQTVNGKPAQALTAGKAALAMFEKAGVSGPDDEASMAALLLAIGTASAKCAQLDDALEYCSRSNVVREKLLDRSFDPANARELVLGYQNTGDIYGAQDRFSLGMQKNAAENYRKALALSERLGASDAKNMSPQFEIARSAGKLGSVLEQSDPETALALYRKALDLAEKLLPEGTERDGLRADAYNSFARPLFLLGRESEARQCIRDAQKIFDRQLAEHPKGVYNLYALSDIWLTWAYLDSGNRPKNIADARKALSYADSAASIAPQDFSVTFWQVISIESLIAGLSKSAGNDEEIERLRARTVQIWQAWVRRQPGSRYIAAKLGKAQAQLRP